MNMNIKVIGLGGVGSILCDNIFRFINYDDDIESCNVILVDGKMYTQKNTSRQAFSRMGNKARTKKAELSARFVGIDFDLVQDYITEINIKSIIEDQDIIFLCVDNHKTRKLVSDYCDTLDNVVLISGGNEFTDGNAQIYIRKEGRNITPSITDYHSEIKNPVDRSPDEMSCEELAVSEPQLLFANLTVATLMCWYFYDLCFTGSVLKGQNAEIYFDMKTMTVRPAQREVLI